MNPSLLKTFTEHACPEWVCPLCHSKSLAILKGSFHSAAIPQSVARWQRIDGELDDIELVFSCLMKCDLGRCGTIVAASGSGFVTDRRIISEFQAASYSRITAPKSRYD